MGRPEASPNRKEAAEGSPITAADLAASCPSRASAGSSASNATVTVSENSSPAQAGSDGLKAIKISQVRSPLLERASASR